MRYQVEFVRLNPRQEFMLLARLRKSEHNFPLLRIKTIHMERYFGGTIKLMMTHTFLMSCFQFHKRERNNKTVYVSFDDDKYIRELRLFRKGHEWKISHSFLFHFNLIIIRSQFHWNFSRAMSKRRRKQLQVFISCSRTENLWDQLNCLYKLDSSACNLIITNQWH